MRTVAIWKRAWLPPSETFVRNQMDSLTEWRGIAFGVRRIDSILSRDDDVILFGQSLRDRMALALFRLRGHSPRVTAFLHDNGVEVVHAHFGSDAVSIWRQCRKAGIPLVVTLHGHDITAGPETPGLAGWRYRRRLKAMFGYATRIIAVSQFIRGLAIARGADPSKVVVRYIGIPVTDLSTPGPLGPRTRRDVVFVGRLAPKKGVQDLLAAAAALRDDGIDLSIAIIGSGPLEEHLRATAIASNLQVEFLGHLGADIVREELDASRIFVAPSRTAGDGDSEGFGLVFLEAAAAGLPVVSYAHGGVVEAVLDGETGILVPEGDIASLAEAIRSLVDDPTRAAAMGAAGRRRALRDFDVRERTRDLERIYAAAASAWRS